MRCDDLAATRRYGSLPWWIVFVFWLFFLVKIQLLYNSSFCSILGLPSPVTKSEVRGRGSSQWTPEPVIKALRSRCREPADYRHSYTPEASEIRS